MKKKLPAIMFYTSDWLTDNPVQLSSLAAQGLWVNMLCRMSESPRRGALMITLDRPMTVANLAKLHGITEEECQHLVDELVKNGVPSVEDKGGMKVYVSRRMLLDEEDRGRSAEGGRKGGGNPRWQRDAQRGDKGGQGSSSSSSSSSSSPSPSSSPSSIPTPTPTSSSEIYIAYREEAEAIWRAIPKKRRRQPSTAKLEIARALHGLCERSHTETASAVGYLKERITAYYRSVEGAGEFFCYPARWLTEERWEEDDTAWDGRKKKL